jgi:hypothetical protein
VGFRGSAAEAAAEGLKKEDREQPARLARKDQQHGEIKELEVYNGRTIKKGAAGNKHQKMEAGPQTGHEGARDCARTTAAAGWATGPWPIPKTCSQFASAPINMMGALSAYGHT